MAMVSIALSILRGLPPKRPRARAAGRPALVRSAISSLELGDRRQDVEGEPPVGGRGVDLRAGAGQHLEADPARTQLLRRGDQVPEVAPQPVQRPRHERVAGLQRLEAGL